MSTSLDQNREQRTVKIWFTDDMICLRLDDGREVSAPLEFYPTLANATKEQLEDYRILPGGTGIHWESLNEDLSVDSIVLGRQAYSYSKSS